jgi:hypothetical protein
MLASSREPAHGYVVGWRRATLVLTGAGWIAAPLVIRPVTMLELCAFGAFASLIAFVILDTNSWWTSAQRRTPSIAGAFAAAGGMVAAVAAIETLGALGWAVLAAVLVSSPHVVCRFVELRKPPAPSHDEIRPLPVAEKSITDMSTPELVHAWRASFTLLMRAHTTAARAKLVARRGEYLQELERRHPEGVRRWLASGARAASDQSRFFAKPAA